MKSKGVLAIKYDKKVVNLPISSILYVTMDGNNAFIHVTHDIVYQTRMTLSEIEKVLGDDFLKVKRGCLVSVLAIHDITDKINLSNGEMLDYAQKSKAEIVEKLHAKQKQIISSFNESSPLVTEEDYRKYYAICDNLPFAFTDIEMVFDGKCNAIDWIFRYGNQPLAELEKVPLDKIVGSTFSSLFPNMDLKWLRTYERSALFGETLKIIDYSPEIDTYLDIICFPTFKGHCGCILFDISKITSFKKASDTEKALAVFFAKLMQGN